LIYDDTYDLTVCSTCHIALSKEWIVTHLKDRHGKETTLPEVWEFLGIDEPSMDLDDIKEWVGRTATLDTPIQKIPVKEGLYCGYGDCQYAAGTKETIKNHYSKHHRGIRYQNHFHKGPVSQPFTSQFSKYFRVESEENTARQDDKSVDPIAFLKEDLANKLRLNQPVESPEVRHLRHLNLFTTKTRWDQVIAPIDDKTELVEMAALPKKTDELYKVNQLAKNYIRSDHSQRSLHCLDQRVRLSVEEI
jgi:hypothetical protein